jgi:hypothetical protein
MKKYDQITSWAKFIKQTPSWKKLHTEFVDAQLKNRMRIMTELASKKDGKKKVIELLGIKNVQGYKSFFG